MDENETITQATDLIARFEGFRSEPYQRPGDRPTIGYGSTYYQDMRPVTLDDPSISKDDAWELLDHFVVKSVTTVERLVTVELTTNQAVALTSFQYNTGALGQSHLLTKLNAGDYQGAADEFPKWCHFNGEVDPGLVKRRAQERALFLQE